MSSVRHRQWVALVVTPLLALSGTALGAAPAQAAVPDPHPVDLGASWLAGQLENGVLVNRQFGSDYLDYGLTIDAAFALDEAGGHDQDVEDITDAVADGLNAYTTGTETTGDPGAVYAGPAAKALALATRQGRDGTAFGGYNLVARLENRVIDRQRLSGRIADKSAFGDYANVIGQAYAAQGLTAAGSADAKRVTRFLLDQQCANGWFRLDFAKKRATDQSCDGRTDSTPDADATSLATLALIEVAADVDAPARTDEAIKDAVGWLARRQRSNGSLGGGTTTEAANTNSTGLAGWVFGLRGREVRAADAAAWVRGRQADESAPCTSSLSGESGAIGYDDAGVVRGRHEGIIESSRDQWRRATAQALPALRWAPAGGTASATGPAGYVKGGSAPEVGFTGLAPGQSLCVVRGARSWAAQAGTLGGARVDVRVPGATGTVTVTASDVEGGLAETELEVLGRLDVPVTVSKVALDRGERQRVRATGLAPGEKVSVRYRGETVAQGRAGDSGGFSARFKVGSTKAARTVTVLGEFPGIRSGSADFRVR